MKEKDQLVKNVSDKKQVDKATKYEKIKRNRELADLTHVLSSEAGRRVLYRIVNEMCHYDADDAKASGSFTYYALGERNIGRIVKSDSIESSIELWQKAEQENWEFLKKEF